MLTTSNTIIKTTPAHSVQYHWSATRVSSHSSPYRNAGSSSRAVGYNSIEYERGPRRIVIGDSRMSHWKQCEHVQNEFWTGNQTSWSCQKTGVGSSWINWYDNVNVYNIDVAHYTPAFDMTVPLIDLPPDESDSLWDEVYSDIAGRSKEYLLSLEDLAGLFSGKSLWKSIRSVAHASNLVARSISQCKKLRRAFGYKASLYDMWLSSKEAVRQAIGLRLGYRFSFKTTLNDISEAIGFSADFGRFAQNIMKRNSSEFLTYTKRSSSDNVDSIRVYSDPSWLSSWGDGTVKSRLFPNRRDLLNPEDLPIATIKKFSRRTAEAFVRARVRYPDGYNGLAHYYQGKYGLDKPLTTLWAIVPLSFVIDYLFNVQDALTYVDNKLNDYLVMTNIGSAWTCETVFRAAELSAPGALLRYYHRDDGWGGPVWTGSASRPAIKCTHYMAKRFARLPGSTGKVHAYLPSAIGADENNWVRSVGTGLELLSQTRLR